jgi:hypothetical protein
VFQTKLRKAHDLVRNHSCVLLARILWNNEIQSLQGRSEDAALGRRLHRLAAYATTDKDRSLRSMVGVYYEIDLPSDYGWTSFQLSDFFLAFVLDFLC